MATATIKPNSEGTTIVWSPSSGTNNALMVDEGVDTHDSDTTYVSELAVATANNDFYQLEDVPGDFSENQTYLVRTVVKQSGRVDDTISFIGLVTESNETTLLTNGQASAALTSTTYIVLESDSGATADTGNAATWNSRKLRIQTSRTASGMADTVTVFCTACEVALVYTASGPATTQPYMRRTGGVPGMRNAPPFGRSWAVLHGR